MIPTTGRSDESTILSSLRDNFSYEVYQDLQEYVFEKFGRPTIILVREPDNRIRPCYARDVYRGFCSFCRRLRELSGNGCEPSKCVEQELDFVKQGLEAEDRGAKWSWGWRKCHMNLMDFYIPIRAAESTQSTGSILAVLIIGQNRFGSDDTLADIDRRIEELTGTSLGPDIFPGKTAEQRSGIAAELKRCAREIPVLNDEQRNAIEVGLHEAVELMGVISTRTLNRAALFQGEELLHALGLDRVAVHIGERALWQEIEKANVLLMTRIPLKSISFFASQHRDHMDVQVRSHVPSTQRPRLQKITFASYEEVTEIITKGGVDLPQKGGPAAWLDPMTVFASERVHLYTHETATGHIIVAIFCEDPAHPLRAAQKAILYEATHSKFFHFIEGALLGIELDHLMAETGHLMGRACAKVATGSNTLKGLLPQVRFATDSKAMADEALWAIEEGGQRLELIRQNFYAFRDHRRGSVGALALEEDQLGQTPEEAARVHAQRRSEITDLSDLLKSMKPFLDREIANSPLESLKLVIPDGQVEVKGARTTLHLVLLNLFDNARKFAYAGTYIKITLSTTATHCTLEFNNLGVGVAPDEWQRVFRPLARSRFRDSSRRIEGLGLGLSYCKRAVEEEFHGTIVMESHAAPSPTPPRFDGDNWVTTVTVQLPLHRRN